MSSHLSRTVQFWTSCPRHTTAGKVCAGLPSYTLSAKSCPLSRAHGKPVLIGQLAMGAVLFIDCRLLLQTQPAVSRSRLHILQGSISTAEL